MRGWEVWCVTYCWCVLRDEGMGGSVCYLLLVWPERCGDGRFGVLLTVGVA